MRITAVGDVMLDVPCNGGPFGNELHDLVTLNLESPLSRNPIFVKGKKLVFCAHPKQADILNGWGRTVVANLANNHILDAGNAALEETLRTLHDKGILTVGAGMDIHEARRFISVDTGQGRRVCLIGFTSYRPSWASERRPGAAPLREEVVSESVRMMKAAADVAIVHLHTGREYASYPSVGEVRWAIALVEWGVDVVLFHHHHIPRPVVEGRRDGRGFVVAYGLGNAMFKPECLDVVDMRSLSGLMLRLDLDPWSVSWDLFPTLTADRAFGVEEWDKEAVLKSLSRVAEAIDDERTLRRKEREAAIEEFKRELKGTIGPSLKKGPVFMWHMARRMGFRGLFDRLRGR